MTSFTERKRQLEQELRSRPVWVIEEREGHTDRLIRRLKFSSESEAIAKYQQLRQYRRVAGVGGKWQHYFTYPKKVEI